MSLQFSAASTRVSAALRAADVGRLPPAPDDDDARSRGKPSGYGEECVFVCTMFELDTSGDGVLNARGYDTTGDGRVDAVDHNRDGTIDAVLGLSRANSGDSAPTQVDERWEASVGADAWEPYAPPVQAVLRDAAARDDLPLVVVPCEASASRPVEVFISPAEARGYERDLQTGETRQVRRVGLCVPAE